MTFTIYAASAPLFAQHLKGLAVVLDKAEALVEARKLNPAAVLATRLYPDMFALGQQVRSCTDHACRGGGLLAGVEPPALGDEETFPALKERVAKAIDFLNGLDANSFEGAEDRAISFKTPRGEMNMTGQQYLLNSCLPNFFFHATTAYDIVRAMGVEIGKRDFMGMTAQPRAG